VFVVDPDRQIQYAWQSETIEDEPDLAAVGQLAATAIAVNCQRTNLSVTAGQAGWKTAVKEQVTAV